MAMYNSGARVIKYTVGWSNRHGIKLRISMVLVRKCLSRVGLTHYIQNCDICLSANVRKNAMTKLDGVLRGCGDASTFSYCT